jgi:hypothetical protein
VIGVIAMDVPLTDTPAARYRHPSSAVGPPRLNSSSPRRQMAQGRRARSSPVKAVQFSACRLPDSKKRVQPGNPNCFRRKAMASTRPVRWSTARRKASEIRLCHGGGALAWGRLHLPAMPMEMCEFQSTPPRGGTHAVRK